jgi:DNA-binding transcriptional LysR family regulator
MADFRLEVFYTVAKRLSFTKAASELYITQPAVTKHIHALEQQYHNKLFERHGNKICLTAAGFVLLEHVEELFTVYRTIDFEMNTLANLKQGSLHLGASTTVSQYVIAPILASFRKKFADININLLNGNTEQIEKALLNKQIELGIIEGRSRNQEISYIPYLKDEIVLVCSKDHPLAKQSEIEPELLRSIPFVLREQGSGTLEVIEHALKPLNLRLTDLPVEIRLGSTESIKEYLLHSSCMAFLSIHALTKELQGGELRVVDVKNLKIERSFYFIHLQGKADGIVEIFLRFTSLFHNLK